MAKYRVLRDMKYAGDQFHRGDVVSDAFIIENTAGDGHEKLNVLLRTRYVEDVRDPDSMLKDDLVRYARQLDVGGEVRQMTKKELLVEVKRALQLGEDVQAAAAKAS